MFSRKISLGSFQILCIRRFGSQVTPVCLACTRSKGTGEITGNVSAPEFPPWSSFPGESLPRKRKPVGSKEFKHVDNNNETRQPVVTGRTREIQLPTRMARVTTYVAQRRERKRSTAQFFADAFSPHPFGQHVLLSQSPEVFVKIFTTLNAEPARFVCAMIRSRSLLSVA